MKIQIDKFKGRIPKLADYNLPNDYAAKASNINIDYADLRGFPEASYIQDVGEVTPKALFRFDEGANEHWIWDDASLNFVRTPLASDTWERVYFSGLAQPRYLTNDFLSDPFDFSTDYKKLGVPAPASAPTPGNYAPGANYRAYIYTYVSRYGEEGLPSPIGAIEDYDSGNVELDDIATPPADRALKTTVDGYIPKVYFYRTNSDAAGIAEFQFICEADWFDDGVSYSIGDYTVYSNELYICTNPHLGAWAGGDFSKGENVDDADLGEVCPSETWNPPDASLKGFVTMANGSIAAFKDNEVHVSIEYLPHAWPTSQRYPVDNTIIGIAAYGTSLFVMTTAFVYMLVGPNSNQLTKIKFNPFLPCVSKESIALSPIGIIYASYAGMAIATPDGPTPYASESMGKEVWSGYLPATIRSTFYDNKYIASYSTGDADQELWGFMYDIQEHNFIELQDYYNAYFLSESDGNLYVIKRKGPSNDTRAIYEWQADLYNYVQYFWRSKVFILTDPVNFSIAEVLVDKNFYGDILAKVVENEYLAELNAAIWATGAIGGAINQEAINNAYEINGDALYNINDISISPNITFTLYVDDELKFTKTLIGNYDKPFRLPKGFKNKRVQMGLTGYIPIQRISIATSRKELM